VRVFSRSEVPAVTATSVGGQAFLLDVRDHTEWCAGHAPQAYHVPMMELPERLGEIPTETDVVVVCRVGSRSAQVVAYLQDQGWTRAVNLDGGMYAWQAAGRPMVSEDGQCARIL
jgi:rhodanese-related sulfurtransferase